MIRTLRTLRTLRTRAAAALTAVVALLVALLVAAPAAPASTAEATAEATGALSTPTTTVAADAPITFNYSAPADRVSRTNWIGFYKPGQKPGQVGSTYWVYTANNSQTVPGTAIASGTLQFPGVAAGTYEVYFLYNDGYTAIGSKITMTVVNAPLATAQTTAVVGTPVSLSYKAPANQLSTSNWVGWYRGKTTCGAASTYWQYTQTGTHNYPPTGSSPVAGGTLTFTGMTVGSYAVCLLYNDGYTVIGSPLIINVVHPTNTVSVTSSGHGTASASSSAVTPDDKVTLTATPDSGYKFAGWHVTSPDDLTIAADGTFTMPNAAVTVQATFVPDSATVHFDGNGADGGTMADQPVQYDVAEPLSAHGYTLSGSDFAGWATSPAGPVRYADGADFTDRVPTDGASITLYARWRAHGQYLVSIDDADHGSGTASVRSAAPGDLVKLTPTAETGYHLDDWQTSTPSGLTVDAAGSFTMPTADVVVVPRFAANTYKVVFDGNGAEAGTTDASTFTYDTAAALAPGGFVRDNYRFAGWSTTPTGAVEYSDQASVKNLTDRDGSVVTLYAQWAKLSVQAGNWPSLPKGFVSDTFKVPAVPASGAVSQPLPGLWNGAAPTSFTKVSGDAWLDVTADGTVTGTAPDRRQKNAGEITVSATSGGTTSTILVEVPVAAPGTSPDFKAATWNAWNAGSKVTDATGKNLAVIAARGVGVIGFQDGGHAMAQSVGAALGWSVHGIGDLGIVSSYPTTPDTKTVFPTASAPAAAQTVSVGGKPVRIWDVHLDESNYGPYGICFDGDGVASVVAKETSTVRYAQARAVAKAMATDLRSGTPLVLLGDLASPSGKDWTTATSASHCKAGAVDWPVPAVFRAAGLLDSYRTANPDPSAKPGNTWSPVIDTNANGKPEPQDRIDYVDYTTSGSLELISSDTLFVGRPSANDPSANSWASDHAAVVTSFRLTTKSH
ncbi:InlB B-repeat-containing protein [Streptomyces sp. NPDC004752]